MHLGIGEMMSIKLIGDPTSDVRHAGEAIDSASDLECTEIANYGIDSDVGNYLLNRDGAFDYGEINDSATIEL